MEIPEKNIYEILDKNPSQETLHILLPVLMEKGELERVIRECLKSLNRCPEDYIVRKILAEAYFVDGKLSEAEAEADNVTSGMVKLADAYRLKAEILLTRKREEEAIECLERYLALSPGDEKAAILLKGIQESMKDDVGEISPDFEEEAGEPASLEPAIDNADQEAAADKKRKKEKLIKVLDAWRGSLKKDADPEITVN